MAHLGILCDVTESVVPLARFTDVRASYLMKHRVRLRLQVEEVARRIGGLPALETQAGLGVTGGSENRRLDDSLLSVEDTPELSLQNGDRWRSESMRRPLIVPLLLRLVLDDTSSWFRQGQHVLDPAGRIVLEWYSQPSVAYVSGVSTHPWRRKGDA